MARLLLAAFVTAILVACGGGGGSSSVEDVVQTPAPSPPTSPDTVQTQCGSFQGVADGGVLAFKGLPYAQAPIGELRWQPPAEAACAADTQLASDFAPPCAQLAEDGSVASLEEDCLYLNVWTPADEFPAQGSRPVLFFIHGGGNQRGATSTEQLGVQLYDGSRLAAASDSIVVTVGYRLGALGFLSHPALSAENPEQRSGNYGLLDQLAALEWVRDNIGVFGGDPERVTIFGESGGARDVCSLVASPLANGLFNGAIMQSGGCRQITQASAELEGETLATAAGCAATDDAGCLRSATVESLLLAIGPEVFNGAFVGRNIGPVVDNVILMDSPDEVIAAGAHNMVPLIFGSNAEEVGNRIPLGLTEEAYQASISAQFGPILSGLILDRYPSSEYASPAQAFIAVAGDAQFVCPARRVAQAASVHSQPVYSYRFAKSFESTFLQNFGAFHGIELFYIFQQVSALESYEATSDDQQVEDIMAAYWSDFAASGDPNGAGGVARPQWQPYTAAADNVLIIDAVTVQAVDPRADQCAFWDQFSGG